MTEKELLVHYGKRIRELRMKKGLSQQELAVLLDMEKSSVSRLEAGRKNSKLYTLYKIADALDVSLADLVTFNKKS